MTQRVTQGHRRVALLCKVIKLGLKPLLQGCRQRSGMRLPASTALGIRSAAERFLDRVKLGDALKSLAGNRRWRRSSLALDLHKLAPQMRPAEGERPGQGVRTRLSGHGLVSLIAVAVDDAAIALEQAQAMNGPTARRIGIDHPRWVRSGPGPVIARERPEVAGFGPAASRIQHRCGGLIDTELRGGEQKLAQTMP
ncbi:hypothetical protein ABIE89_000250 [Bradyrhizobium niftali]